MNKFLLALSGALLVACGGGGSDSADKPSGYDPSLPEQTITAEELQNVSEIKSTSKVTVNGDVALLDSQNLIINGDLTIN